jgi:hypothetical protein
MRSASYTSASTMEAAGEASAQPNWVSGWASRKRTVSSSGVSIRRNEDLSSGAEEPGTSSRMARSMLNLTSSEVSRWPLWNVISSFSVQVYVVAVVNRHSRAASGLSTDSPGSAVISRWNAL